MAKVLVSYGIGHVSFRNRLGCLYCKTFPVVTVGSSRFSAPLATAFLFRILFGQWYHLLVVLCPLISRLFPARGLLPVVLVIADFDATIVELSAPICRLFTISTFKLSIGGDEKEGPGWIGCIESTQLLINLG